MKKKVLMILLLAVFITAISFAASITVKDPHNGTLWIKGKKVAIRWTNNGNTGKNVKINIFKDSITSDNFKLQLKCSNSGLKKWIIPTSFIPGTYYIRIKGADADWNDTGVHGDSVAFKIRRISLPSSIGIRSPNRETVWYIGKKVVIKWLNIGNTGKNVKINIFKNLIAQTNFVKQLKGHNTGSKEWIIPINLKAGKYIIRIKGADANWNDTGIMGDSKVFSITTPSIAGSTIIEGEINKPDRNGVYTIDKKYQQYGQLDLDLGCKIEAKKTAIDRLGLVRLKVSYKNATSCTLIRKYKNGKSKVLSISGASFPYYEGKIKDEPIMDCEYRLTVFNKTGQFKTSKVKVKVIQDFNIYAFNCPKKVKEGDTFSIVVSITGAKIVSLTDDHGKSYPTGFKGEYRFIKRIKMYFDSPTKYTLTIKDENGKKISETCKIKKKRVIYLK
jgi:type 1 fimbria pilin